MREKWPAGNVADSGYVGQYFGRGRDRLSEGRENRQAGR